MRRLSIATAVLLGIVVFTQQSETQELTFPLFERYLESFRTQAGIPGMSVAVIQNGRVAWERGFGRSDVDAGTPTSTETTYPIGALSQTFGATLLLRKCVDQWGAQLDDPVVLRSEFYPEPQTTLRDLLSHTAPWGAYQYSPARFAALTPVIERCAQDQYGPVLAAEIFDRLAMFGSSPDQALGTPGTPNVEGYAAIQLSRYADAVGRLATPYRVVSGRPQRNADLLPPRANASDGIVSSVRDLARFDAALSSDVLLAPATRNQAWTQTYAGGMPMPTGLGWFVQNYRDQPIVWQFGTIHGGYSSLVVKVPNRSLTLVLLANSDGLNAPFNLEAGDVTTSIFASLFLRIFVP